MSKIAMAVHLTLAATTFGRANCVTGVTKAWQTRSQWAAINLALTISLILATSAVSARVIQVGPDAVVKTIAEAARLAKDDDVVEIAPGVYPGDVTVWKQKKLTIGGVGERPVLSAAGRVAEGKAIWVIRNGDFHVSNLEFRGARAGDGNGAGIRFENGKLTILECAFFDNQTGILTGNTQGAELTVEGSIFGQAPKQERPLPHLLYAGRIDLLRITGSRFHGGHHGHLLKSRARTSDIRYDLLIDGPESPRVPWRPVGLSQTVCWI